MKLKIFFFINEKERERKEIMQKKNRKRKSKGKEALRKKSEIQKSIARMSKTCKSIKFKFHSYLFCIYHWYMVL